MTHIPKIITLFGTFLGLSAAVLPTMANAEYNTEYDTGYATIKPNLVTVNIDEYYEISVISGTGGEGVTYSDGTYVGGLTNNSALDDFGKTVLSVVCNGPNGWKLQAKSGDKDDSDNAVMTGAAHGFTIPSSSTDLDGSVSTWTMQLAAGTGDPTITSGFESTHLIPADSTTIATGAYGDPRQITVTYGVGVDAAQVPDTYIGSIEYTVLSDS